MSTFTGARLPESPDLLDLPIAFVRMPTAGLSNWQQFKVLASRRRVYIREPFVLDKRMVPPGWSSDGLSLPRGFRSLADPWGVALREGVQHDFETRFRVRLNATGEIVDRDLSRKDCDDGFHEAIEVGTGMPRLADAYWSAVRAAGWYAWSRHRQCDDTGYNDVTPLLAAMRSSASPTPTIPADRAAGIDQEFAR